MKTTMALAPTLHRYIARFTLWTAMCLLCVPSPVFSGKAETPETVIKFATLAPEGSTWMKAMRALDLDVRNATGNRLGFKFYTGGVQGDEKDVLRKVRNGQLHGGGFTGYGLGSIAPEVRVLELPFMFENLDEVDVTRSIMSSYFAGIFDQNGYLLLGWADVGFINIFTNTPVTSPDDLKDVKMWIWSGDPLAALFFKAFDITPIPLSVPDVLTSLQMGVIDAVYASPLACIAVQWFTRVKYMTDVPVTHSIGAVLVSKQALESVAQEDIDTLLVYAGRHLKSLNEKTRLQNLEAVELMKKEGIEILTVSDESRQEFFTLGRRTWDEGVGDIYPQELLDRISAVLKEYRANREHEANP